MEKAHKFLLKCHDKYLKPGMIRFLIVGGVGFVVNFIGLTILFHILNIPILVSQLLSAEVALLVTFVGNNYWSFRGDHHHTFTQKIIRYHMSGWIGLGLNSLCVVVLVKYAGWYYGLALVIGALVALTWNYTLNKKVIFLRKTGHMEL